MPNPTAPPEYNEAMSFPPSAPPGTVEGPLFIPPYTHHSTMPPGYYTSMPPVPPLPFPDDVYSFPGLEDGDGRTTPNGGRYFGRCPSEG